MPQRCLTEFRATPGSTYALSYSSDLAHWTDIGSVTSDGTSAEFTETSAERLTQPRGYYRVVLPSVAVVPVITSPVTATATLNAAFAYQITASNSPFGFMAIGLPAGLVLNPVTGLISGPPAVAGTNNVTVTATNAGGPGTSC